MCVRRCAFGVALASILVACSPGPMTLDGITILRHKLMTEGPAALFEGTLHFRQGCAWADADLTGETQVMVWPPGAQLVHGVEGQLVLVVGGVALEDGGHFAIGGGQFTDVAFIEGLSGPIPAACKADLYWLGGEIVP